jgi:hypothetical protein
MSKRTSETTPTSLSAEAGLLPEIIDATSASSPLDVAGFLEMVLSYVGPGHWNFIGAVSSFWSETYASMEGVQLLNKKGAESTSKRCSKKTYYSSVLVSPSTLRCAHAGWLDCKSKTFIAAASKQADVPTLLTAQELGMRLTQEQTAKFSKIAAEQQSLAKLQWLSSQPLCKFSEDIGMYAAIGGGSVEVFTWLTQHGVKFSASTIQTAAVHKHNAAVQYLHSVGCPWSMDVVSFAAGRGDLPMLHWACEAGDVCWSRIHVLNKAAASGSVEMVAWIAQQPGVVFMTSTMCAAAEHGHTAVCEYLLSQGCPMTAHACTRAAAGGHLSTLKWLQDNGCPGAVDAATTSAGVTVAAVDRIFNFATA